jgi:hypothetical protein
MTHEQITKAIQSLRPNAEWTLTGDDYANLIWLSNGKAPTRQPLNLQKKMTKLHCWQN